jgi:MFS family permease
MVFRIIFGAFFGALFGYIMGWFIELFPRFNGALLEGLRVIFGIGGVRTAALLAAIGFAGGIFAGIVGTILHYSFNRHCWHRD